MNSSIKWYDKTGKVIANSGDANKKHMADMQKVEELLNNLDYKIVKQENTPFGRFRVSTVWIGLDHGFNITETSNPAGYQPLIFETMVFSNKKRDEVDKYYGSTMNRYSTEKQAKKGHAEMLAVWTKIEYDHSIRGHVAKAWKAFWQFKTSWNRVPGMLFWAGTIIAYTNALSIFSIDKGLSTLFSFVALVLYIPAFVQLMFMTRRHNKEWRWTKIEMFVSNMLIEHEMMMAGDDKAAKRFAEIREQLKKW